MMTKDQWFAEFEKCGEIEDREEFEERLTALGLEPWEIDDYWHETHD